MASADRYRNAGPETSIPWRALEGVDGAGAAVAPRSRAADVGRKVFAKTGVVGRARGSAYVECGNTKITVGVYGPRDLLRTREYLSVGKLDCELKFAPFSSVKRRAHIQVRGLSP